MMMQNLKQFGLKVTPRFVKELGKGIWRLDVFRTLRFNFHYYVRGKVPILVYQVGKVGSKSVFYSLLERGEIAYHVHSLEPDRIRNGIQKLQSQEANVWYDRWLWIHREIIQKRKKIKVITLYREPIGLQVSSFFQNLERVTGMRAAYGQLSMEELHQIFLEKHCNLDYILNWYDEDFIPVLGINLFDHPFPHEKGYQIIKQDNIELLVLRLESSDALKEQAVEEFTGLKGFKLRSTNVTGERGEDREAEAYANFKRTVAIPEAVLEKGYSARVTRYFYTDDEIANFHEKWSRSTETVNW